MKRTVYFISDGTGITAQNLGHSLLTQFDGIHFESITVPYIDTPEKAGHAIKRINESAISDGCKPLIFSTLVNPEIRALFNQCSGVLMDFFNTFIDPLENELQIRSSHRIGQKHGLVNDQSYKIRIDAVNYALAHDDGLGTKNYEKADLILVGVSRSGKTPTCLYLALQFGIFVANYPLTEEDLQTTDLPLSLQAHREKLFGLTIEPKRLQDIRTERRPNSSYASLEQCRFEIQKVEELFLREHIPHINSTTRSIEEIAATILATTNVKQRLI